MKKITSIKCLIYSVFFRKLHGWLRSKSRWLSHLLFIPSAEFSGMLRYYDKRESLYENLEDCKEYKRAKHSAEVAMKYSVPQKYRGKIKYFHLPAERASEDPLLIPGYVGWNYKP